MGEMIDDLRKDLEGISTVRDGKRTVTPDDAPASKVAKKVGDTPKPEAGKSVHQQKKKSKPTSHPVILGNRERVVVPFAITSV